MEHTVVQYYIFSFVFSFYYPWSRPLLDIHTSSIGVILDALLLFSKKIQIICIGIEFLPQAQIFQSMAYTFDISNLILSIYSLKYQGSTTLGCKDIGIRKSEFVAKTQFLCWSRIAWELNNDKYHDTIVTQINSVFCCKG